MGAADTIIIQRLVRSIHKTIAKATADAPDIVAGTVTQVSPLMVMIPGAKTAAPAYGYASYTGRTLGDRVVVHTVRNELYVAGKLA
jgi:hypothetical protein